jgi:hypothetical protein
MESVRTILRRLVVLGGLCVFLLLTPAEWLSACVCGERGTVAEAFKAARVVFVGRVVALEVKPFVVAGRSEEGTVATFEIERGWKGASRGKVRIRTCGTQVMVCTCGVDLQLGERYVVFAAGNPLETSQCDATDLAAAASELIGNIERLATKK